jgi:hypothetical protein
MEYIVKKTVEAIYTIEADSKEEAIKLADAMESYEADQISVYEIEAESIEEYEEAMKS